ncbi:MAG: cysteine--1-D-myo-inosityl 2-amino-2-deoxy-alpha-D-glucopyranoside ligase [Rothia sp. (in: high G+C Gram-positive bacteria)]|nr:cysteine--1-D-myo-inosityl 2-amino-2-deoxy-alpha-D-glucopyranoside ligase [Rothia sp. (in: high G+C Gram-positive bacteria)]
MRAWKQPTLPTLPGQAPLPTLFDTAQQTLLTPQVQQEAGLYVCGITPYDATHLGHAATYLAYDLLNRAWRDAGLKVTFVQNVTDVDDPLLERAQATGVDWQDLAQEQTDLFRTDMEALQVIAPDHYVSVVDSIPAVAKAVRSLLDAGLAYRVPAHTNDQGLEEPAGDIYADLRALEAQGAGKAQAWKLGQVAHYDYEQMLSIFAERGGDPQRPGKKDPLDPLLWRVKRDNDPSWQTEELGEGRPGWHIECSVISFSYLGAPFTLQGGGSDLIFPHHDLGSSHTFALTGQPMAKHYVHTGMVGLEGEKMSKSKGNLVLVSQLRLAGVDPAAIRLALLDHHYRSDWFWQSEDLSRAQERLELYRSALAQAQGPVDQEALVLLEQVRQELAQDLNAPAALSLIDRWAQKALDGQAQGGQLVADLLAARLGLVLTEG